MIKIPLDTSALIIAIITGAIGLLYKNRQDKDNETKEEIKENAIKTEENTIKITENERIASENNYKTMAIIEKMEQKFDMEIKNVNNRVDRIEDVQRN